MGTISYTGRFDPTPTDDYNTMREMARASEEVKPTNTTAAVLTASEVHHLDSQRKKFMMDLTAHIRNGGSVGDVSDGYHTFNELYHHRAMLFAALCHLNPEIAWKSKQHDDPENNPMYDGMFICGIQTPTGQATYHYDIQPYWELFHCQELETAPAYDGHSPAEAIQCLYDAFCPKSADEGVHDETDK